MRSPEEKAKGKALLEKAERDRIETIQEIRKTLLEDLELGHMESTLRLPILSWLDVLDEIEERHPRNYGQLVRDYHVERLNDAVERLHEEIVFLIAYGPVTVSERIDRAIVTRQAASPELLRVLRDQDEARGA